jgi:hypothetical protein
MGVLYAQGIRQEGSLEAGGHHEHRQSPGRLRASPCPAGRRWDAGALRRRHRAAVPVAGRCRVDGGAGTGPCPGRGVPPLVFQRAPRGRLQVAGGHIRRSHHRGRAPRQPAALVPGRSLPARRVRQRRHLRGRRRRSGAGPAPVAAAARDHRRVQHHRLDAAPGRDHRGRARPEHPRRGGRGPARPAPAAFRRGGLPGLERAPPT